jgi:flagellin-like hook-associated protein FlgL
MSEIEGVFKTSFRNWLFSDDYNWAEGSYNTAASDRDMAIIREFLLGNRADVQLSAEHANPTVSMVQVFEHAAGTIRDKLSLMEELAEKAASGYYTSADRASMQKHLEQLAGDIKEIVNDTEHDGNKLFTAEGHTISKSIGPNRDIHLFAKDLTFDVGNIDLVDDANGAVATVGIALEQAGEYADYLKSQQRVLQDAVAAVEAQLAGAAGLDPSSLTPDIAEQFVNFLSSHISDYADTLARAQFNITADRALQLLKDRIVG